MPKWAVCLATIRPEMTLQWLQAWEETLTGHDVDVYIMEDTDHKQITPREKLFVYDHSDVASSFGEYAWIIPRHTAACRSYVLRKAYEIGYDYYVSLDDDCFQTSDLFATFEDGFRPHVAPHYNYVDYATLFGYKHHVRGYPYGIRKARTVAAQYGLWIKVPDYDALTMIEHGLGDERDLRWTITAVPKYSAFTGCMMNAAITHKYVPVMYQLLMGSPVGYDRVEDIWSSLILKRIADHFEDVVLLNGEARVLHDRASNPYRCLDKELPAMLKNEKLWEKLLQIKLSGNTPLECYWEIIKADVIPEQTAAMSLWADMFEGE